MVTWGVTDAGENRIGRGLDAERTTDDWVENASTSSPAPTDDRRKQRSVDSRANAPITGSTTRLTIPATTARSTETYSSLFHGKGTIRLADQSFSLSDGSSRLSCTLSPISAAGARETDDGPTTVVAQFQGPATPDRQECHVHRSFDRSRSA